MGGTPTEVGVDSNSRVLELEDVVEGVNWVHVVPVSGSGMRAAAVGRIPLKVDCPSRRRSCPSVLRAPGSTTRWT